MITMAGLNYSDEQDLELALFNRHYRMHVSGCVSYANRFVSIEEAKDLVHDVFVKLWMNRGCSFDDPRFRAYLYRCVLNACRDYLRHQSVESDFASQAALEMKLEELHYHDSHIDDIVAGEQLEAVYRQVDMLPEKCAEIFRLFYLNNKKSAEIADELKISKRTVESQLYKALRTIRKSLLFFI